jgi:hypothetical protein
MTKQELHEAVRRSIEEGMKKERAEWYERGIRHGKEELKAELRELLGIISSSPQSPD